MDLCAALVGPRDARLQIADLVVRDQDCAAGNIAAFCRRQVGDVFFSQA